MTDSTKILEGLNPQQRQAVETVDGPLLIVAGAGSGKTRVLTSRIAYILAGGVDASRIMALTFTKKAAQEMKERIALMVGPQNARHLVMGTFHSVFIRFLRDYADFLGYPRDFTIYDTSDSQAAIKACVKELQLDDKIYKPKEVLSRISDAKNNLVLPSAYRANPDFMQADMRSKKPRTGEIYELYQKKLKASGVMDFDDILLNMNILMKDNAKAWMEIADRFSYILVDEYQDTNYSQYLILKRLSHFHHNICVVGDDSQSIYAFRGARIENILKFSKDYPESRTIRLERNYRSTSTIVDAANSVIAKNSSRIPKKCYSEGEKGDLIRIIRTFNENEEAVMIAATLLEKMRETHAQYQDFAILYRTNSQSRVIEEVLRRRNLPYMIYSGNSFFERAEIKDMMAYLKLVVNPRDDESFKRVVNKPARGIGDTTVNAVIAVSAARGCTLLEACRDAGALGGMVRGAAMDKLGRFASMIEALHAAVDSTDALVLAKRIADDSGLYASYKEDTSIEGLSRLANIDELLNSIASYADERLSEAQENNDPEPLVTLGDFLENVSLLSNVDVSEDEDDSNKIALMTVHSAKGLEFPYVFVAGMEENLFPSGGNLALPSDVEEERRLFYVALTRAKSALFLSFARERMRNGQHQSNAPSRFLKEIDPQYIANPLSPMDFDVDDEPASGLGVFGPNGFRGYSKGTAPMGGSRYGSNDFGRSSRSGYGSGSGSAFRSGSSRGAVGQSGPVRSMPSRPLTSGASPSPVAASASPQERYPNFVAVPMTELFEGERIEHNRFGAGKILKITGVPPELKAEVNFDEFGLKTLLLKYAKLRPEKK